MQEKTHQSMTWMPEGMSLYILQPIKSTNRMEMSYTVSLSDGKFRQVIDAMGEPLCG